MRCNNPSDTPLCQHVGFYRGTVYPCPDYYSGRLYGSDYDLVSWETGILINQQYHTGNRIEITYEMPLGERLCSIFTIN